MKKIILFSCLILCLELIFGGDVFAQESSVPELTQTVQDIEQQSLIAIDQSMALSETLTRITGTAIYPVFGLAFLGLYDDINDIQAWYATPYLYSPLLLLMLVDFVKNTLGLALGPLKKFGDVALQGLDFINAHLGLVMSVGIAANSFQPAIQDTATALLNILVPTAYASTDVEYTVGSILLMSIAGVIGGAIYFVIWVSMQSFALLILLSPFNILDSILRSIQLFSISILLISFLIFPPLAVFIACCYIAIALILFRMCWSYLKFSTQIIWDLIFKRGKGTIDLNTGIQCFSDDKLTDCYPRTKGLLKIVDDALVFESTSLIGKNNHYSIERNRLIITDGTLYSTLQTSLDDAHQTLVVFSPAYNGREEELATALNCTVEPSSIIKGFRMGITYIKSQYNALINSRKASSAT